MPPKSESYPIFEECKHYTLDPYWLDIFESCAKGKFPKGLRYSDGVLMVYIGKKSECITLNKNAKELYITMIDVFKNKLGLKSPRDTAKQRLDVNKIKERLATKEQDDWKHIRPKKTREMLISQYVLEMGREHNLTGSQEKQLLRIIKLGMAFKAIQSGDVSYHDGKIHSIDGIEIIHDDTGNVVDFDIQIPKNCGKTIKSTDEDHMIKKLRSYVRDYKNKSIHIE